MNSSQTLLWIGGALLLFWTVGGYNRLVRMRNAIQQHYAALDARVLRRNEEVAALAAALAPLVEPALVDVLRAALGQSQAAREQARKTPCDARAITNLGVTETVLGEARVRLAGVLAGVLAEQGEALAASEVPGLVEQVEQAETALGFAREQFNRSAAVYNAAVRQFPTRLLAAVFGFGSGATLPARPALF